MWECFFDYQSLDSDLKSRESIYPAFKKIFRDRIYVPHMKMFSIPLREVSLLLPLSQHADLLWGLETVIPNVFHLRYEALT